MAYLHQNIFIVSARETNCFRKRQGTYKRNNGVRSLIHCCFGRTMSNCIFKIYGCTFGGTRWRSWLRHCATSRKVAGSIPDVVIGIFLLT